MLQVCKADLEYPCTKQGNSKHNTKFITGIPHTDTCTYTDIGTDRQIPFLHFTNLIFGTPHTHKYTQTHAHTQTQIPFLDFTLFGIHAKDIWHTTDLHMCHGTLMFMHWASQITSEKLAILDCNHFIRSTTN